MRTARRYGYAAALQRVVGRDYAVALREKRLPTGAAGMEKQTLQADKRQSLRRLRSRNAVKYVYQIEGVEAIKRPE